MLPVHRWAFCLLRWESWFFMRSIQSCGRQNLALPQCFGNEAIKILFNTNMTYGALRNRTQNRCTIHEAAAVAATFLYGFFDGQRGSAARAMGQHRVVSFGVRTHPVSTQLRQA